MSRENMDPAEMTTEPKRELRLVNKRPGTKAPEKPSPEKDRDGLDPLGVGRPRKVQLVNKHIG